MTGTEAELPLAIAATFENAKSPASRARRVLKDAVRF